MRFLLLAGDGRMFSGVGLTKRARRREPITIERRGTRALPGERRGFFAERFAAVPVGDAERPPVLLLGRTSPR